MVAPTSRQPASSDATIPPLASERLKRHIEPLLDKADQAINQRQWDVVRARPGCPRNGNCAEYTPKCAER